MNKDLIIFGTGKIAEVVFYYATVECGFRVVAFVVDEGYKDKDTFQGLQVASFHEIDEKFPAVSHDMFVAVGYQDLNKLRTLKCQESIAKGYNLVSIISPKSSLPLNVVVGKNCFIMPPSVIHPCVTIGDNVFIWSGAMVGHHSSIKDNCWLTSCCNISGNVVLGKNCFLAVNATVGNSITIGDDCFLGANTLVTKSMEDKAVVITESSKPTRLNSAQFLRISSFSNL